MRKILRLIATLVAMAALMLPTVAMAAQTPTSASAELAGQFTGQTSAAGGGAIDGVPVLFSSSWNLNLDGKGIPRTVAGVYDITAVDGTGSLSIRFSARLQELPSGPQLIFNENWAVVSATGVFEGARSGSGTSIIDLTSGPAIDTSVELRLRP